MSNQFNFSKSKIFLFSGFCFVFGVSLASFLPASVWQFNFYFFVLAIIVIILSVLLWPKAGAKIFLPTAFLFLALWRYGLALPIYSPEYIYYYNGQSLNLTGRVKQVDVQNNKQKLKVSQLRQDNQSFKGVILVITNLYPSYTDGDVLEFKCKLKAVSNLQNPSNFNYSRWLAKEGIYSFCYYPKIKVIEHRFSLLSKFRQKLRRIINYNLPEPEASMARAMVLGDKKNIPDEWQKAFSRAGLAHILAISGMHIGIISIIIMFLLLEIGFYRQTAFWIASFFILVYIILIGAPVSAIRAGIMGFLMLLVLSIGRLKNIGRALLLAVWALPLINPLYLRDDIGFQLSSLAVFGIINFYPLFQNWRGKLDNLNFFTNLPSLVLKIFNYIWEVLAISISVQIMIWPIIAWNFSLVSPVSILTNVLVLGIVPLVIVLIFLGFVFNFLPIVSFIIFLLVQFLFDYIMFISNLLLRIPNAFMEVNIKLEWLIVYYLIIAIILGFICKVDRFSIK